MRKVDNDLMSRVCAGKKTYEAGSMGNEKSNDFEGCRGI